MTTLPYALIDADNHYYETTDCFTRHIESAYADRTLRTLKLLPYHPGFLQT